jgi:opacity protein-like surface antigen/outer membrane protease
MNRFFLNSFALLSVSVATVAHAADLPVKAPPPAPAVWSWTGFYVGGHVGGLVGTSTFSNPYGSSVFGGTVTTPGFLSGLQIGYNWTVAPRWVLGLEADGDYLVSNGTSTCMQASGSIVGSNCRVRPRALGTLTGRLGFVPDLEGRTLVYGKGGAAWSRTDISVNPNNANLAAEGQDGQRFSLSGDPVIQGNPTSRSASAWGWTVGAGVERALTPAWSASLEYDYYRFNGISVATPETISATLAGVVTNIPVNSSTVTQDFHVFKVGLNYRWGADPSASWTAGYAPVAMPVKARPFVWAGGWDIEAGGRYWYSSGRSENGNGIPQVSRLTYNDMSANSGELFGRVDTPSNVFVKGFAGLGSIFTGKMNDEDWSLPPDFLPNPTAYEVTQADKITGSLSYATADIGYDILRGPNYKVGPFVGYNYFHANMNAIGCTQLVQPPPNVCAPASPSGAMLISEKDTWQSLRLGVAAEAPVWDRFKISGDVAYLPYVHYSGVDTHWARTLYFPSHGEGLGVQSEVILSYLVTESFSVGVGGRYWAMWTTDASQSVSSSSGPPGPYKANVERYGVFVQAAYKFAQ